MIACILAAALAAPPDAGDYGFLWWAYGPPSSCCPLRGRPASLADGKPIVCIRTGRYGLAIDTKRVRVLHLGAFDRIVPAATAVEESNEIVFALPEPSLGLTVRAGDRAYRCAGRGADPEDPIDFPVRIIQSGRFFQRFDILGLAFADDAGNTLAARGRLEIAAWPDRLRFILEVTPDQDLSDATLAIGASSAPLAGEVWKAGTVRRIAASIIGDPSPCRIRAAAEDLRSGKPVEVARDAATGSLRIALPRESWRIEDEPDRLDRVRLHLANESDREEVARLLFAMDGPFPGITGMSPMLRDARGNPTGIPVQISKNWHRREGRTILYEGPWFHGASVVRVPPRARIALEFSMAYARWGGVPAASHAQLCLIGWGHNQLWEEVAIGSWGESICYEPDGVQRRCLIDDVRPLMVLPMQRPSARWTWTNNVGGGDFLACFDGSGTYRFLSRMRAHHEAYGPNLTAVTYAGVTDDGRIAARIRVSTPRCDDINRAFHSFRYEVLEPVPFRRLAFYQLGSDHYLWHPYRAIARGNEEGLVEEWTPALGGSRYHRRGIPCEGEVTWFSLHRAESQDRKGGAWANRALIIRSWRARLGGRDGVPPFASLYGTQSGIASASLELSPPPGLERLEAGDFVEAEVELAVLPQSAGDYYGPNEGLRAALRAGANTWRPVLREAAGNHLRIRAATGTVEKTYPIRIRADREGDAAFEVTGGIGYVPITFTGLAAHAGYTLEEIRDGKARPVDQSVHGRDFWQADHDPVTGLWRITYNVCLDGPGDRPRTVGFRFGPEKKDR